MRLKGVEYCLYSTFTLTNFMWPIKPRRRSDFCNIMGAFTNRQCECKHLKKIGHFFPVPCYDQSIPNLSMASDNLTAKHSVILPQINILTICTMVIEAITSTVRFFNGRCVGQSCICISGCYLCILGDIINFLLQVIAQ